MAPARRMTRSNREVYPIMFFSKNDKLIKIDDGKSEFYADGVEMSMWGYSSVGRAHA